MTVQALLQHGLIATSLSVLACNCSLLSCHLTPVSVQIVSQRLSLVMLLAIEVAVEFWLSLKFMPQAQLLSELDSSTGIAKEVRLPFEMQAWSYAGDYAAAVDAFLP